MPLAAALFGVAATFAFDGDMPDKLLGAVLMASAVGAFAILFYRLHRLRAAISDWFGVKIKGLPLMNTRDFDRYCQKQGLRRTDSSTRVESSREANGPPVSDAAP